MAPQSSSVLRLNPRFALRLNPLLVVLVAALAAIGIAFIYGTGQQVGAEFAGMWRRQLVWLGAGTMLALALAWVDYETLGRYWWVLYLGSLALLIMVLLTGQRLNGARSWLPVLPGISVQPSEFAKLGIMVALSWVSSRPSVRLDRFEHVLPLLVLAGIPFCLIGMQPDMGSALTIFPMLATILFLNGIPKRWLVYALALAVAAAPVVYTQGLSDHQRNRIKTFLNPGTELHDAGWNAHQSILAVGSGGLAGKGFMQGTQNPLGFLPRRVTPTDFIFSVIAEETGFLGSTAVLLLLMGLVTTAVYIGIRARDAFGRNLACTFAVLLSVHIYVNVGMTMGMAPIIGIPLPLVSYGGSFMLTMLAGIGLLQSIYLNRPAGWAPWMKA
jgi:rod shape determining protein RodA